MSERISQQSSEFIFEKSHSNGSNFWKFYQKRHEREVYKLDTIFRSDKLDLSARDSVSNYTWKVMKIIRAEIMALNSRSIERL